MRNYFIKNYPLPNFIIAGASKSASSSVHKYLSEHPQCLMSDPDNPAFFCVESNYKEEDYYENFFPEKSGPDLNEIEVIGEGTSAYLFFDEVPKRMNEFLLEPIKLLFILRNPVERSISHYFQGVKKFTEKRDINEVFDFEANQLDEVIEEERKKVKKAYERNKIDPTQANRKYDDPERLFQYVYCSTYSHHLERYLSFFDDDQIKILLLEELKEDSEKFMLEVEKFLGIDKYVPENLEKKYHKTIIPREGWLSSFVHDYIKPMAGRIFSSFDPKPQILRKIYHALTFREKPDPPSQVKKNLSKLLKKEQRTLMNKFNLPTKKYWNL